MPAFGALTKPLMESPGNWTAFSTPGCCAPDLGHLPDHLVGSVQRGRVGQLGKGDQVLLVLGRHETLRHLGEADVR